jgi:hypothetical protein
VAHEFLDLEEISLSEDTDHISSLRALCDSLKMSFNLLRSEAVAMARLERLCGWVEVAGHLNPNKL